MKFDSYNLTARVFPAILSSIPFFVLHFYYLRPILGQFWDELLAVQIVTDITITLAFLFLLMQLSRFISKEFIEKRLYADGLNLPTTNYLLHLDSHFSPEYTSKIHTKINTDFGIKLPSIKDEATDTMRSRKLIAEAVGQIRARVGNGRLVNQHNAEYGFSRNLAGGAIVALLMAIIDVAIFSFVSHDPAALWISIILVIIYFSIAILSKTIISSFGSNYAQKLIEEYMS